MNGLLGIRKTMRSARYFESMVTYDSVDLPFVILDEENEIDNNIRLVTKEFAISKAEQNKATFGSNAELMEANVIHVNDSIYWCMIYAPKTTAQFWTSGQFNLAWGLILVEVNNPNAEPWNSTPPHSRVALIRAAHNKKMVVNNSNLNISKNTLRNKLML